jgi:porin
MIESTIQFWRLSLAVLAVSVTILGGLANAGDPKSSSYEHQERHHNQPDASETSPVGPEPSFHKQHTADGSKLSKHHPTSDFLRKLNPRMEEVGLLLKVDIAFYDQQASSVIQDGVKNLGTYSWRIYVDWRFLQVEDAGSLFFNFTLLGSFGFNYTEEQASWTRNIGSVSELNGNIYPDESAIDEMFIKYVSPETEYVLGIGKLDLSNRFDTNAVANDAFRQFFAFALENNLSIPWPDYGGIGAFFRLNFGKGNYLMVAGAPSVVRHPFEFGNEITNENWYQIAELGITVDTPFLGEGHYKLTPWHNRTVNGEGWGVGVNFDQEIYFKDLISFFRFGYGEPEATPIEIFISAGLTWLKPFGRKHDMFGVGVAWSDSSPTPWTSKEPHDPQSETLIEIFYRASILTWLSLTPDLQIVHHPATDRRHNIVYIPGIRLQASF